MSGRREAPAEMSGLDAGVRRRANGASAHIHVPAIDNECLYEGRCATQLLAKKTPG